jgi:hypothetical protein
MLLHQPAVLPAGRKLSKRINLTFKFQIYFSCEHLSIFAQTPTLIGCLFVKDRGSVPRTCAVTLPFQRADLLSAQKRDYAAFFTPCQLNEVFFLFKLRRSHLLPALSCGFLVDGRRTIHAFSAIDLATV